MKNRHKYFRQQRHINKLKKHPQGWKTYWSHVKYIANEPDARDLAEHETYIHHLAELCKLSPEDAKARYLLGLQCVGNKKHYVYYTQPEVTSTVHKVITDSRYSKKRSYWCKQANKRVRQQWKQKRLYYQHSEYKKVYDVVWTLD